MIKNPVFAAIVTSIYLLVYYMLFNAGVNSDFIVAMFLFSPVLMTWLVLTVLKDKRYTIRELASDEEWGYADRDRASL